MRKLLVKTVLPFLRNNTRVEVDFNQKEPGLLDIEVYIIGIKLIDREFRL